MDRFLRFRIARRKSSGFEISKNRPNISIKQSLGRFAPARLADFFAAIALLLFVFSASVQPSYAQGSSLQINTSSFPEGNPHIPFHATLSAQGGSGSYTWRLNSGSLPPGLSLNSSTGVIEGTPSTAVSRNLNIQVSDSIGNTAVAALAISIVVPNAGPKLPMTFVSTTFPNTSAYTVTSVPAGADLQAAINSASCNPTGTVLRLASGATFEKHSYTLPAKTCAPNQWIIIRTDTADSNLPGSEQRIDFSYSPVLAKIFTNSVSPAIATNSKAAHYWLMGLEIGVDPAVTVNYGVITIGNKETQSSALPHHIVLDRCYVHGNASGQITRGLQANGTNVAVINSYFENFHNTQTDAQAIAAWNTPGPLKIVNNFLEGSGENVMFGGANPTIKNVIQSDIEIRLNHFFKPLTWKQDDPSYGGIPWAIKNLLEFKNAQRVLVEGNVLEQNWAEAQDGFGILFTPRGQSGNCPWCTVANITFRYNLFQHSGCGFNIAGEDNTSTSQPSQFIGIHDNLMVDINGADWGGADGKLYLIVDGNDGSNLLPPHDMTIDHNTGFQTGNVLTVGSQLTNPMLNFVFTNNIQPHNQYGIGGTGTGIGNATLTVYFVSPLVTANIFEALPSGVLPSQYPPGNFFPPDWTTVQFMDYTNGDYRLQPTSPYHDAGTDGKDVGGDIGAVNSATLGVSP